MYNFPEMKIDSEWSRNDNRRFLQERSLSRTIQMIDCGKKMKAYKAMIWDDDPEKPGRRVSVLAESLDDAKKKLEEEYGEGHVFYLHNEEDAARPR